MRKRIASALLALVVALSLCGCKDQGTLAFSRQIAPGAGDESGGNDLAYLAAELSADDFCAAFEELLPGVDLTAIESGQASERAFRLSSFALQTEYAGGWELHVFAPAAEVESVVLTMPLPPMKSEKDVPKGDGAALANVQEYNDQRNRERATYMECAEAIVRAANKYKNVLSEADVMLVLANTEKTVKRGTEKFEKRQGATVRSFLLDMSYTPKMVFTIEFTL